MGFLDNIKPSPSSGSGGSYMRFSQGENKLRIVGSSDDNPPGFIQGMIGWTTDDEGKRKPHRWKIDGDAPKVTFTDKPKEFFTFVVWNYAEEALQIMELTQAGLKEKIIELAKDEDWGDPRKYDISIIRNGEGIETSYVLTPKPHKKRSDEINEAVASMKVNLNALYEGGDPFEDQAEDGGDDKPSKDPF